MIRLLKLRVTAACLAVGLVGVALGTSGCASAPKVDWSSRVGTAYSYDDAVREMGPPDKATTLSDGSRVADWYAGQGPSFTWGFGTGSYGRHSAVGVGQSVTTGGEGRYLRLTFGPDGGLRQWSKAAR